MTWRGWLRRGLIGLGVVELVYLVIGNAVLSSGLIPHLVEGSTERVKLHWDRAWTYWPGQSTVEGFSMQIEDEGTMQIDLRVERATTHIRALPLFQRRISLDHTRAHGVTYRMLTKVDAATVASSPRRIAAFPHIEAFSDFVKPKQRSPPATDEQIDKLFGIEMTDVVADMRELWFDEYRYVGPSHVKGGFALQPLKELWVGPANLTFDGGELTAGGHVLLPRFTAAVECKIGKVSLFHETPEIVATTLDASVRSVTAVEDIGIVDLYLDGVEVVGSGLLKLDVSTRGGRVTPESRLELSMPHLTGATHGFSFAGPVTIGARVTKALALEVSAGVKGQLATPALAQRPLAIAIDAAHAELVTKRNDLHEGPGFDHATVIVSEARADDARPLTEAAARYVPIIGPAVLGEGPVTGELAATYTPQYTLLRLKQCSLGSASLAGAMLYNGQHWQGAAAGKFGALPIGLLVDHSKLGFRPSVDGQWLGAELERCGIAAEAELEPQRKSPTSSPHGSSAGVGRGARGGRVR
jgi:hypothetical protein